MTEKMENKDNNFAIQFVVKNEDATFDVKEYFEKFDNTGSKVLIRFVIGDIHTFTAGFGTYE
jgi:hypothetical protein